MSLLKYPAAYVIVVGKGAGCSVLQDLFPLFILDDMCMLKHAPPKEQDAARMRKQFYRQHVCLPSVHRSNVLAS